MPPSIHCARLHPRRTVRAVLAIAVGFGVWFLAVPAVQADSFTCAFSDPADPATAYCQFRGVPMRLYSNAFDAILLYWDTALRDDVASQVASVNIPDVSIHTSGIFLVSDNPGFADRLHTTLLVAKLTGGEVIVQMRGTYGGRLKIDRVWLQ